MRRRLPPEPVVIVREGDWASDATRADYLRQCAAARQRMAAFDALPDGIRQLATAASTMEQASSLWRNGVRTFRDAEDTLAAAGEVRQRRLR